MYIYINSQNQERCLAPSTVKETHNHDRECLNHQASKLSPPSSNEDLSRNVKVRLSHSQRRDR